MSGDKAARVPFVSERVQATDLPVIVKTKQLMSQAPAGREVLSLAQGVVHWGPPPAATAAAAELLSAAAPISGSGDASGCRTPVHSSEGGMRAVFGSGGLSSYGPADGLPALVDALKEKLAQRNGLHGYEVMVTNGANQAFINVLLTLVDSSDKVVLFTPYYFNHLMAVQMTGGADAVVLGPCDTDSQHPDLVWLEQQLQGADPPKLVVIVNPCNPTGVLLPIEKLESAAAICAAAGAWLLLDNTYEDFVYDRASHHCVSAPNVLHVFSFSKAYGMMGWRVGYIAYPGQQMMQQAGLSDCRLGDELRKIQDTIAICPTQLGQHLALAALQHGDSYIRHHIANLKHNRELVADALSPLGQKGTGWVGGEGAIYYWAKLPERYSQKPGSNSNSSPQQRGSNSFSTAEVTAVAASCSSTAKYQQVQGPLQCTPASPPVEGSDEDVVAWLIREHGVCVIPGSACGAPGYLRVAYANVTEQQCEVAAARLKAGLQQLVSACVGTQLTGSDAAS